MVPIHSFNFSFPLSCHLLGFRFVLGTSKMTWYLGSCKIQLILSRIITFYYALCG